MENKVKHLEMIQGVINRLSHNSFLLKGWSVILVSGLFAFAAKNSNHIFIILAYFPALVFWVLDGYFLWQEKLFRKLYDKVREMEESQIDFSMDRSTVQKKVSCMLCVVFSKTLLPFHGAVLATITVALVIMALLHNP